MREFITAVKAVEAESDPENDDTVLEWTDIKRDPDDPENEEKFTRTLCRAYRPEPGQLAYLLATTGRFSSVEEQIAGGMNFLVALCDDDTSQWVASRLLDRKDPYGWDEIDELMAWMVEEWGGRPTKQPSDYAQSRKTGGQKSKRRTPALTSSVSQPTDS